MKRVSVALILLSLSILAGCQTSLNKGSHKAEGNSQATKLYESKRSFQYEPGTNEEFRLKPLSPGEQKFGYSQLCLDTKSFTCEPLPYAKYKDMKGFFLSMEPARVDYSGYEFRRVVLQNGKRFFYVSNESYGGIYTKHSPIRRVSSSKSRIGKPIAAKSTITIAGIEKKEGGSYVNLSNGVQIKERQFTAFIKVIASVSDPDRFDELTRLLAEQELVHDIAKDRIIIHHYSAKKSPLQAYIINKHGKLSLLIRHQYTASKWLHPRSFALLAGKTQYKSTRLSFESKEKAGKTREWHDAEPKADYLKVLTTVADAKKATLRFYSNNYFIDREVSFNSRVRLKQMLHIYQLLK
jgi:hypothetical protein